MSQKTTVFSSPEWMGRGPRVAILGPQESQASKKERDALYEIVKSHAEIVVVDQHFDLDMSPCEFELVVVFGGDGSVLRSARKMGANQKPVLGVNLGQLGFLAALPPDQLATWFPKIVLGECHIVHHLMLECTVVRDGQAFAHCLGLNEAAILGGPPYSMLDIDLYVDDVWATTYSCDGLIISTPVGSTAHGLSAGGPILRKTILAFAISPISPHTLTVRPVVDSANRVYEMVARQPNESTSLVVDGKTVCALQHNDRVQVVRSSASFQLIEIAEQDDYKTLREKLGWHGSISAKRTDPH